MKEQKSISSQCFSSQLATRDEHLEYGNRALWYAVLERAILDISGNYSGVVFSDKAKEENINWCLKWKEEDSETVASFPWVCSAIDVCPFKIKKLIENILHSGVKIENNHIRASRQEAVRSIDSEISFVTGLKAA